ncbi:MULTISPECIES: hypothetical protein [Actinomadura]|uniref:Uncharacterized protein n=1 Tax=Actinomadura miaoliensis TaxID=430685 RepID=A0ABP7VNY5_9ACTN
MPHYSWYPEDDPRHHTGRLHDMLTAVIRHAREDLGKVDDPRAQALLETTAEVCTGLKTAFEHYERQEPAWREHD